MSRIHFVVMKFPHIGIDASSLNFNGSFNLHEASTLMESTTLGFRSPGLSPTFSTISINNQHIIAKIINKHVSKII